MLKWWMSLNRKAAAMNVQVSFIRVICDGMLIKAEFVELKLMQL